MELKDIYVIKGDDAPNIITLQRDSLYPIDILEVTIDNLSPIKIDTPEFPISISLTGQQTQLLQLNNNVVVSEYINSQKHTYNGIARIRAVEAPTDAPCEYHINTDSIIKLCLYQTGQYITLNINHTPQLMSSDNSVQITETQTGYDLTINWDNLPTTE